MPHGADSQPSLNMLNIQYSVFLGVILGLSFYVDSCGTPKVCPVVDLRRRPEALLFTIYFILDWFTANIVHRRGLSTPLMVLGQVGWIAMLGTTVVALNGIGSWKLWLLTVYLIVSGVFDIWFMKSLVHAKVTSDVVMGLLLAGMRLLVGASFLIPSIMCAIGRSDVAKQWDDPNSAFDLMFSMTLVYIALKVIRFRYLLVGIREPQNA